jgi:NitT/TauT family transport system substrate-binding protein
MFMRSSTVFALLVVLMLVTACGAPAIGVKDTPENHSTDATQEAAQVSDALTPITLFLGYIPNVQFAPIYVAIERGYFRDAGIDLKIEHSFNETDGLTRIGTNALQFGLVSGEQVALARAQGAPVVYVFRWYQRFPVGVVVPAPSDITEPSQLMGRIIGVPGKFGASYVGFQALLNAVKLTEADLKEVKAIGFETAPVVCSGQVEASVVYVANEPEAIKKACFDVRVIHIAEYANIVSNGLVTNEQTIRESPDLVRGMNSALARGLADTITFPVQAMQISTQFVEGLTADDALQFTVLRNSIELWKTDRYGLNDPAAWQLTVDTLKAMGLLTTEIDVKSLYSNDFLP